MLPQLLLLKPSLPLHPEPDLKHLKVDPVFSDEGSVIFFIHSFFFFKVLSTLSVIYVSSLHCADSIETGGAGSIPSCTKFWGLLDWTNVTPEIIHNENAIFIGS